jgi:acyl-CoA synthetase (AMP-forming)/AMP-acid ligase II
LMFLLATPELSTTDVSSLKNICYGASPISEDILTRSMKALGCDFTQLYGLTETCGAITSLPPEDHDPEGPRAHLLRSAGKPFDHVSLRIVDPDSGATVSPGTVGEVWTRSDQNMLGYWQKADETAAVLTDQGWFHTGDAGWVDAEGYLFLHDRLNDMIVSGGENIYPAEVENILFAHPDVADAAVIGVPDDKWGETVKAIVVRTGAGPAASAGRPSTESPEAPMQDAELEASIIAFARDRLAHYKCPTSVAFAEVLPRNATGKVLKRELREPFWRGRERHIH